MAQQPELALGVGALSERGPRDENQDKMTSFSTPMGMVYLVADGMGGHRGGAEASRLVVEGYRRHLADCAAGAEPGATLQRATMLTNEEILAGGAGMGSTVVLALLYETEQGMEVVAAHVGDSRAYLLRDGTLRQMTHDHSAVQRMVDEGLLSAEAARRHPSLNVLTRALGKQREVELEVGSPLKLLPGDALLLCTDGLWGYLSEERIAHELGLPRGAGEAAEALVRLALEAGSDDNVTAQVVRLENTHRSWDRTEPAIALPLLGIDRTRKTFNNKDVPTQTCTIEVTGMKQCPICFQTNPATATVCRCGASLDRPALSGGGQPFSAPSYERSPSGGSPVTLEQRAMSDSEGYSPSPRAPEPSIRASAPAPRKTEFFMARPGGAISPEASRSSQDRRESRVDGQRKIVGLLVTYTWKPEGECFPVREGRNWIGRNPDVEISLACDPTLSSVNTSIVFREGIFMIGDKDSMGGTDVDGKTVWPEQMLPLTNYARIRTGSTAWTFIVIDPPAA